MTLGTVYRRAMRKDASRLYDIRRRSILELAPPTMTVAEAPGRAVGAALLDRLEGLMRDRQFRSVRAEASSNARGFYLRGGYRAAGPQTPEGAWPMAKELLT
jgi:putative acetyltransferase